MSICFSPSELTPHSSLPNALPRKRVLQNSMFSPACRDARLVRPRNKLKIRNNLSDARAVRPYNLGFCNTLAPVINPMISSVLRCVHGVRNPKRKGTSERFHLWHTPLTFQLNIKIC